MICRRCQRSLADVARFCPRCGAGVTPSHRGRRLTIACVVIGSLFFFAYVRQSSPQAGLPQRSNLNEYRLDAKPALVPLSPQSPSYSVEVERDRH